MSKKTTGLKKHDLAKKITCGTIFALLLLTGATGFSFPFSTQAQEPQENLNTDRTLEKAGNLFKQGRYESALAIYLDYREQNPGSMKSSICILIGNCYASLQRFDEALEEYKSAAEKIIQETPGTKNTTGLAELFAAIGDIYLRQNKFAEAEKYLKKSIEINSTDYKIIFNIAEILFAAGKFEESIAYYEWATRINPGWPKPYIQLGYAYMEKNQNQQAVEAFNTFLQLSPNSPDAESVKEALKLLQKR